MFAPISKVNVRQVNKIISFQHNLRILKFSKEYIFNICLESSKKIYSKNS